MMKAKCIAERLNQMLLLDPEAVASLIGHRVVCDKSLAADDSPFVCSVDAQGDIRIGMVGVINALAEPGTGRVAAFYNDCGQLTSFTVVGV